MNLAYFKFLFINLSRKKSTWISFSIFLFTIACFLLIVPAIGTLNPLQAWAQPTMVVCQSFVILIGSIFTAILTINIFKDSQEDGSDLIIIAKPVKKLTVIFTKLLVFTVYCLIASISSVLITSFILFLPKIEYEFYWKLLISLFIGNTISLALYGSIAILLSTKLSKIGIMITNVCIALILLVYQIVGVFVIPSPTKSLIENKTPAHSYIIQNRNFDTGEYIEEEVVTFTTNSIIKQNQKDNWYSWKDVESYWKQTQSSAPTNVLNITDVASQLSYSYLSAGLQNYSDRQAKRFFGSSNRAYNYTLDCPASPEIMEEISNKKSLQFIYLDQNNFKYDPLGISIALPNTYAFSAIKAESASAIKGLSNKLPIGVISAKEILSESEVYLEKEKWNKFKPAFEIMFNHCFKYDLGINKTDYYDQNEEDPINFYKTCCDSNNNIAKMYDLVWACFLGKSSNEKYFNAEILKDPEGNIYDKQYFEINSIRDLNERLIQFKYYVFLKAQEEQEKIIKNGYVWENEISKESKARTQAINTYNNSTSGLISWTNLSSATNKNWYMTYKMNGEGYIDLIQPNTQTVNFQLMDLTWENQKSLMENEGWASSSQEWIANAKNSALYKTLELGYIANYFAIENEKYLYSNFETPERTADSNGEMFNVKNSWIPYPLTLITSQGQNVQIFFYSTNRKYNYYWFTLIWLSVALILIASAVIIYNKYDIK